MSGLYDGICQAGSVCFQLVDTVYEDDRVVHRDTYQHHDTDHSHHIDRRAGQEEQQDSTYHRQWNCQQDRERMQQRFELGSQHHIHQDDRQGKSKQQAVHRLLTLLLFSGYRNRIVDRQFDAFHRLTDFFRHLVQRLAGIHIGHYLADAVLVTPVYFFRGLRFTEGGYLTQAELLFAILDNQIAQGTQRNIRNLDDDVAHLSAIFHLSGFFPAELLFQLFDDGRYTQVVDTRDRPVDRDRYLRSTVFNGRYNIIESRYLLHPAFHFFRNIGYFIQFFPFHFNNDRGTFATQ